MTDLLSELFDSAKPHILDLFEVKAFRQIKNGPKERIFSLIEKKKKKKERRKCWLLRFLFQGR